MAGPWKRICSRCRSTPISIWLSFWMRGRQSQSQFPFSLQPLYLSGWPLLLKVCHRRSWQAGSNAASRHALHSVWSGGQGLGSSRIGQNPSQYPPGHAHAAAAALKAALAECFAAAYEATGYCRHLASENLQQDLLLHAVGQERHHGFCLEVRIQIMSQRSCSTKLSNVETFEDKPSDLARLKRSGPVLPQWNDLNILSHVSHVEQGMSHLLQWLFAPWPAQRAWCCYCANCIRFYALEPFVHGSIRVLAWKFQHLRALPAWGPKLSTYSALSGSLAWQCCTGDAARAAFPNCDMALHAWVFVVHKHANCRNTWQNWDYRSRSFWVNWVVFSMFLVLGHVCVFHFKMLRILWVLQSMWQDAAVAYKWNIMKQTIYRQNISLQRIQLIVPSNVSI